MTTLATLWRTRVRGTERARDVSDAVLTFLVGLLLIAVGLVGVWSGGPTADDPARWWYALPLLAVCAVMLGKRRRPVLALTTGTLVVAVDAALGGSTGTLLGFIDLIHAAALYARPAAVRRLHVLVGVIVAAGAAATFVVTGAAQTSVNVALFLFAVLGTPLWWGRSVRQQAELAALANARAADLQQLADLREAEAVRGERTRMARDLHDALAGNLAAIAIHAEAALSAPEPAAPPADASRDRSALRAIRAASVTSLQEMRAMILVLRSDEDDDAASPARLGELDHLLATARAGGLDVRATADVPDLPSAVDQAAYRIVQEALTNAARHAAGAEVAVELAAVEDRLRIVVTSTGGEAARPAGDGTGLGLVTMRERAEALGGTFSAGWADDDPQVPPDACDRRPWRVTATIPLEGADA